jgi:hypothetical protein
MWFRLSQNHTSGAIFNPASWNISTTFAPFSLPKFAAADNVLYVSKAGNDSNDGRAPGSARLTIQAAINTFGTFGAKGVIRVGPGVFTEDVTHYDGVSVIGAGSGQSTIKTPAGSTALGAVQIARGPVTAMQFEGFRIEGSGNAGGIFPIYTIGFEERATLRMVLREASPEKPCSFRRAGLFLFAGAWGFKSSSGSGRWRRRLCSRRCMFCH